MKVDLRSDYASNISLKEHETLSELRLTEQKQNNDLLSNCKQSLQH